MVEKIVLPLGYQARPAKMDDLDSTLSLLNEWSRKVIGRDKFTPEDQLAEWQSPGFDMANDTQVVLSPDGKIVGYYDTWDPSDPHVLVFAWGRVHPGAPEKVEAYLLAWAEQRTRQSIDKAPAGARVALQTSTLSLDERAQAQYRQAGFQFARHYLRMVIHLEAPPSQVQWPEGITVRSMISGREERATYAAVRESFQDHWGHVERPFEEEFERWKYRLESTEVFDPALFFLAMQDGEIAGVSLCWMRAHDDPQMGWVGTLGVRRLWRRKGLGLALLRHSFRELYLRGHRKVGLGVDANSLTGATRLYEKAGMRSEPTHQFSVYEKVLRPGLDLRTLAVEESVEHKED